jgi:hypothetical protein
VPSRRPAAQAARNEDIFRQLNEHLEVASSGEGGDIKGFVCECSDISCTEVLAVPLEDYERVRRASTWFIVAPGEEHVDTGGIEHVVERTPGFWVVEKIGLAGAVADALDDGG